jgi:hypothetical protein
MKSVFVEVTAADIAAGARGSCFGCPVALALTRALDLPAGAVYVEKHSYSLDGGMIRLRKLPPVAREWIANFDCIRSVEPFRFSIYIK